MLHLSVCERVITRKAVASGPLSELITDGMNVCVVVVLLLLPQFKTTPIRTQFAWCCGITYICVYAVVRLQWQNPHLDEVI